MKKIQTLGANSTANNLDKMKHLTVSCDFGSKIPTRLFTSGPDACTVVLYLFFVVVVIAAG